MLFDVLTEVLMSKYLFMQGLGLCLIATFGEYIEQEKLRLIKDDSVE